MKVTACNFQWRVFKQVYKNSTLSHREASPLVVNSMREMLHISMGYAYVTRLSVTESRIVQG